MSDNIFLKSNKAQIAETTTWVVATMIIIVVLGISILFTVNVFNEKKISVNDKKKDFLATKSVTSFLNNPERIKILSSGDNLLIKTEVEKIIGILPVGVLSKSGTETKTGRWNFKINGEKLIGYFSIPTGSQENFFINFTRSEEDSKNKLNLLFWETCIGKC